MMILNNSSRFVANTTLNIAHSFPPGQSYFPIPQVSHIPGLCVTFLTRTLTNERPVSDDK